MVCSSLGQEPPKIFAAVDCSRKLVLKAGLTMPGAPWPEFAPIWLGHKASQVSLCSFVKGSIAPAAAASVIITPADTAVSLRMKHAEQAAALLASALDRDTE